MNSKKRILIAPLNWGLGHATRCIPIIKLFLEMGHDVIIGANGAAGDLLKSEFPHLKYIEIPGYDFRYGRGNSQVWTIIKQLPQFLQSIIKEHNYLNKLISSENIDIVIADNRYGLWNKKIPSVIITHQIFIKAPTALNFLEPILHKLHFYFLKKFNYCWIPDLPDHEFNLSGDLSHLKPLPKNKFKFIGLLSRFEGHIKKGNENYLLAVISGPEPQRSLFQKKVEQQLLQSDKKSIIIAGTKKVLSRKEKNLQIIPFCTSEQLLKFIEQDPIIISRSGYSSLMDYIALDINPIVVPTPGQTEQEYLAKYLKDKKWCYSMLQNNLHIKKGIEKKRNYKFPEALKKENNLLQEVILEITSLPLQ